MYDIPLKTHNFFWAFFATALVGSCRIPFTSILYLQCIYHIYDLYNVHTLSKKILFPNGFEPQQKPCKVTPYLKPGVFQCFPSCGPHVGIVCYHTFHQFLCFIRNVVPLFRTHLQFDKTTYGSRMT